MVLIALLHHSRFSCFDPESKQRCHDNMSRTLSALVAHRWPIVASEMEVPGAGSIPQGAASAEVADVGPRLGGRAWGLSQDLVVHGSDVGIPRSVALGDAASALGPSSTFSAGVSGLYLSGSFDSPPPPINWRRVEDEAEFECLQVVTTERLLHETLASVHQNILRPVWVSLKTGAKSCSHSNGSLHSFSSLLGFCFRSFYLGAARMCLRCWLR
jgi:hypothetical protein